ncbi:MAG: polysaccharide deacetylase family protein [Phycisphaeraceae bacterium]|nr:polysaccharide deacetylase family protein [Phycisphaerales bacterium]MCB9861032.1 polysaccharide deacetylase family protein [Phycisphaeraceae bacterium]
MSAPIELKQPSGSPANLVLTYHYVRPENSDGVTGLTPEQFRDQLMRVQQHYTFVTLEEFLACEAEGETGFGLITFDDAVKDQWKYAQPVLASLQLPAVFFAPMRPFSHEPDLWVTQHLLHALAEELGWRELEHRVESIIGHIEMSQDQINQMNSLYHYEVPEKRMLKWLIAFGINAKLAGSTLREINERVGLRARDWFMSEEELVALQDMGHAIGGHGFDHVPYTTLTPMQQASDMHRAQRLMANILGAMPRALAYPFGRFDEHTRRIASQCGYTRCFSTTERIDACALDDLLDTIEAAHTQKLTGAAA